MKWFKVVDVYINPIFIDEVQVQEDHLTLFYHEKDQEGSSRFLNIVKAEDIQIALDIIEGK